MRIEPESMDAISISMNLNRNEHSIVLGLHLLEMKMTKYQSSLKYHTRVSNTPTISTRNNNISYS